MSARPIPVPPINRRRHWRRKIDESAQGTAFLLRPHGASPRLASRRRRFPPVRVCDRRGSSPELLVRESEGHPPLRRAVHRSVARGGIGAGPERGDAVRGRHCPERRAIEFRNRASSGKILLPTRWSRILWCSCCCCGRASKSFCFSSAAVA